MQHTLTVDKHLVEDTFHADLLFGLFLVVMTLLFILAGVIMNSGTLVPADYVTFW